MKLLIRICTMAVTISALWPASAIAQDKGCPFARIAPVPEGKAVIYLYKVGYGRGLHPISVNGAIVTSLEKPGYYAMVVSPGKYDMFLNIGGMLGTPTTTVNAQAGREYFLELLTRFAGKFKEVPESDALKDLKKTRLTLPYWQYEQFFLSEEEGFKDPVFISLIKKYPKSELYRFVYKTTEDGRVVGPAGIPVDIPPVVQVLRGMKDYLLAQSYPAGQVVLKRDKGEAVFHLQIIQHGFARSCGDKGDF